MGTVKPFIQYIRLCNSYFSLHCNTLDTKTCHSAEDEGLREPPPPRGCLVYQTADYTSDDCPQCYLKVRTDRSVTIQELSGIDKQMRDTFIKIWRRCANTFTENTKAEQFDINLLWTLCSCNYSLQDTWKLIAPLLLNSQTLYKTLQTTTSNGSLCRHCWLLRTWIPLEARRIWWWYNRMSVVKITWLSEVLFKVFFNISFHAAHFFHSKYL